VVMFYRIAVCCVYYSTRSFRTPSSRVIPFDYDYYIRCSISSALFEASWVMQGPPSEAPPDSHRTGIRRYSPLVKA
jgi:hypothetical protein